MVDIKKILEKTTLQNITSILLYGFNDDLDDRPLDIRMSDEYNYFVESMKNFLTQEQIDEVLCIMNLYIITIQDTYFNMGIKCGAKLLHQLLDNGEN